MARSWGAQKHQKHPPERQERAKRRQETKKTLPGSIRGGILAPKIMILGVLFVFLPCAVLIVRLACCRFSCSALFCVFWPCTQKAERPNSTHAPSKNVFFQGARLRRLCRKDDNRWSKNDSNREWKKDKQSSKNIKFQGPGAGLQKKHKK